MLIVSAPGRTELGGNHTDHQHGCVLAAAVDLHTTAHVTPTGTNFVRVFSDGYAPVEIDLRDLTARPSESATTAALVRGVLAAFLRCGATLSGFDATVHSEVLPGSGLSSSAAFEVLMGRICNNLFCQGRISSIEIAKIGQFAENMYFGKPCGLMDQMASSVGGVVFLDFADPDAPRVEHCSLRLDGYSLYMLDSGASHADLTDEYAAIPAEMGSVSAYFGQKFLRNVSKLEFFRELPNLRGKVSDRALLRAIHFFEENARVQQQVQALRENDTGTFLRLVTESGQSSWMDLQNVIPAGAVAHQELALTLTLCRTLLAGRGACRVHGGGFAGTVQAFVPNDRAEKFQTQTERILGHGRCRRLKIEEDAI